MKGRLAEWIMREGPDELTHRFMDRNKPKGLRKNSNRDKFLRKLIAHPARASRKRKQHGRQ